MCTKIFSGVVLLGWQLIAFVLGVAGQADIILSVWPDPAWLAMLLALLLKPPVALAAVAITIALLLFGWSLHERREAEGPL